MSPVGAMCGVTPEAIASTSAYAVLATLLPRMEFWLTILEEIGCAVVPPRLDGAWGFVGVELMLEVECLLFSPSGTEVRAIRVVTQRAHADKICGVGPYVFGRAGPWRLKHSAFHNRRSSSP